jgi:hexosaminidase
MTTYKARVQEGRIVCQITASEPMQNVVFCCSLMAEPDIVSGGARVFRMGGYGEFSLPDLAAGQTHEFTLCYANRDYRPVNRAWLPLGPYLRHRGGTIELEPGPSGAQRWVAPPDTPRPVLALNPKPVSWRPSGGLMPAIGFRFQSETLDKVDALAKRRSLGPFQNENGVPLAVEIDAKMPVDGYSLAVASDAVVLRAGGEAGVFYGGITLLTLLNTHGDGVPLGEIEDAPGFEWRGQHLDCARHFFAVETILDLLDAMALQKLNRFHWHFADDEAFRLELPSLPALLRTLFRGEGELLPGLFGGGVRAGGIYTRADAERVIDHAASLFIDVMPETEFPAHALCLNMAIDGMRDPEDTGTEESVQGYAKNTLNPAMDQTWTVIEAIIADVADIFPFSYIHVGCDELPDHTWEGSPAVTKMKQQFGLTTTDDVQAHMMRRIAAIVTRHGKRPAAWEEAARGSGGGIGTDTLLFSWTGQGPGIDAAIAGYDVVMCPAQHVYLDMAHTNDPDDWGAAWAAFVDLPDTIDWIPVPKVDGLEPDRIKGVQGEFWGEFTTRDWEMANLVWPRLLGVAAMAWGAGARTSANDLISLAGAYQNTPIATVLRSA